MLPLIMVRDDLLMTGDTSFAVKHFDQLVSNALGAVGTPWPVDPTNGRECNTAVSCLLPYRSASNAALLSAVINTSDVLVDWPSGMRDHYVLTQHNSVANAFGVYGLDTLVEIAGYCELQSKCQLVWNFLLKSQKVWRISRKNDDFVLKNGHLFCNSRYLGRTADVAKYKARAVNLRASINKLLWNATGGAGWTSGGAYTDGLPCKDASAEEGKPALGAKAQPKTFPCSSHTAFHSSVYMLALGAVPQERVAATHEFINAKILPKSIAQTVQSNAAWPPPPPAGEHDGMPCGVYVSQFALQALYQNAADHGQAALELLTSTAKNSWLNMLKQGATASME